LADAGVSFSPASLFAAGEPGVWYDPSDFSTMFQDSAGITPETAVEQPVGLLLDKSQGLIPGNNVAPAFVSAGTGWTVTNTDATHYATFSDGSARFYVSSSTPITALSTSLTANKYYLLTFTTTQWVSGQLKFDVPGTSITIPAGVGTYQVKFYSASGSFGLYRSGAGVTDITFSSILLQEVPGNHATQATSASRPVLSARVNLLTKTEQFDDAAWSKSSVSLSAGFVPSPDGGTNGKLVIPTATSAQHLLNSPSVAVLSGQTLTHSFYAKAENYRYLQLAWPGSSVSGNPRANFDVLDGVLGSVDAGVTASITAVGDDWFRCVATVTFATNTNTSVGINFISSATAGRSQVWTADGTSGIYIWGADLRVANDGVNLPVYQRVNTSTDYDTTGFPYYLRFDGSDDSMVTNTITPGIDKAQVFAGVRKLSDAAQGVVAEMSATIASNNGTFLLAAPDAASATFAFDSKGTTQVDAIASSLTAPLTRVVTGIGDISGDTAIIRINGVQADQETSDQGTGNYLAYPLYIGRRAGTSLPFNGRIYSLITRFGANLDVVTINNTEVYVSGKMGGGYVSPITGYDFLVDANGDQITDASDNPLFTQVLYT
jgi:hypothetical protein